jgi:hypothetical protein
VRIRLLDDLAIPGGRIPKGSQIDLADGDWTDTPAEGTTHARSGGRDIYIAKRAVLQAARLSLDTIWYSASGGIGE